MIENAIITLNPAGNSAVSQEIQIQVKKNDSYHLYITEVDEKGVPDSGNAAFGYNVIVENGTIAVVEDQKAQIVTITNQKKPEHSITPTVTPQKPGNSVTTGKSISSGGSSTPGSSVAVSHTVSPGKSVKTGDSTPIGMYVSLLLMAAVIAMIAAIISRRRKTK